jgi:tRNA A-37 threonylcarbamoyl transferase component Bud32
MGLPPSALPGAIGRYRPVAVLGAGGMGTVYRAHDPVIDRQVALKVIRTEALGAGLRSEYLDRFRLEAQAAGRCSHPAIVAVFDFFEAEGNPAIVMEFVAGRTLAEMLRGGAAARAAVPIAAILGQVLDGLAYAHRLGVTHRDIKPANIIVTDAGQAKIADFGIARLADMAQSGALTQTGAVLGTPSYMAPEQLGEGAIDHRADLFAVGAILYEALTGRPPFAGRSTAESLQRLAGPDPASMVAVEAAGAGAFVPVLQRALAKPRERRFAAAEEFAQALALAAASPPPPARGYEDPATLPRAPTTTFRPGKREWDPATLQRVERALAQYLGPMARVMVAQAARSSASTEELFQALARGLQSAADRSAFLRSLATGRMEPRVDPTTAGRAEPSFAAGPPTGGAGGAIPPEAQAAAQAALAQFMGPIARVLVRQAAAQATSAQDFFERLCAHLAKPEETAALRRRLAADVAPKLR